MSLPDRLQAAVSGWLAGHSGRHREGSAALSATYRAGDSAARIDLGCYLVTRLPATFAAVSRVLAELARRRPDLAPESLLDAVCPSADVSLERVSTIVQGLWRIRERRGRLLLSCCRQELRIAE